MRAGPVKVSGATKLLEMGCGLMSSSLLEGKGMPLRGEFLLGGNPPVFLKAGLPPLYGEMLLLSLFGAGL